MADGAIRHILYQRCDDCQRGFHIHPNDECRWEQRDDLPDNFQAFQTTNQCQFPVGMMLQDEEQVYVVSFLTVEEAMELGRALLAAASKVRYADI